MKFKLMPGEYLFRAMIRPKGGAKAEQHCWFPTPGYFACQEDAEKDFPTDKFDVRWPAELEDNGVIYLPDSSELE